MKSKFGLEVRPGRASLRAVGPARWRQLGWLALLGFTAKGVVTTSLMLWALLRSWP